MSDTNTKRVIVDNLMSPEVVEPVRKRRRARSIINEFFLNTSTHGLPGIARSESIHNRLFWIATLSCFTGIMLYFITQ